MTPQPQHCDEKFRELAEEWLSTYGGLSETSLTYAINDFAEMVRVAYNTNNHSAASRPAPSQCPHYELRDGAYYCRCEYDKEHDAAVAAKAREDKAVEVEQLETSAKQKYEFATTKHEEVYQQGIVMGLQMAIKSLRTGGDP